MEQGKIYTTYFKNIDKAIGVKISIASSNPIWLSLGEFDEWLPELSPGYINVEKLKRKTITREEFINKFKTRLIFNKSYIENITSLLDNGTDVTLVCYETPKDFCHRHIVREHIQNLGYEGDEINVKTKNVKKKK